MSLRAGLSRLKSRRKKFADNAIELCATVHAILLDDKRFVCDLRLYRTIADIVCYVLRKTKVIGRLLMKNIEQELKLALTEREYEILLRQTDKLPVLQTNYYFAFDGQPNGTMIRLRCREGSYTICCKRRLTHGDGVMVCDEYECDVESSLAQKLLRNGISYRFLRELFRLDTGENAIYVGKTDTWRVAFDLDKWHVELDKNCYLGITDYELECENDHVEELAELKSYLNYAFGIVIRNSAPKNQRFNEALAKM